MTNLQKIHKQGKLLVKVSFILVLSLILNAFAFWQFLNKSSDYSDCMASLHEETKRVDKQL